MLREWTGMMLVMNNKDKFAHESPVVLLPLIVLNVFPLKSSQGTS